VNFSLGGLYVFSEKFFPEGEMVNLSIELEQKGEMKLTGKVVRTTSIINGESWGIAFDLTRTYSMKESPKRHRPARQFPERNHPHEAKAHGTAKQG
jgi:Tfp pilus assembly protein PilZ